MQKPRIESAGEPKALDLPAALEALAEAQDTQAQIWALADHWRMEGSLGDREKMGKSVQAILGESE